MTSRLKTRSDYHVFDSDPQRLQAVSFNAWLKPMFWLVVGAVLGMSYNKKEIDSCYDLLAFTEAKKQSVLATSSSASHQSANSGKASFKA